MFIPQIAGSQHRLRRRYRQFATVQIYIYRAILVAHHIIEIAHRTQLKRGFFVQFRAVAQKHLDGGGCNHLAAHGVFFFNRIPNIAVVVDSQRRQKADIRVNALYRIDGKAVHQHRAVKLRNSSAG